MQKTLTHSFETYDIFLQRLIKFINSKMQTLTKKHKTRKNPMWHKMTVYWCDYLLVYCTHIRAKKNPRAEFYVGIIIFNMILVSVLCSAPWHALYWKCLAMSIMVRSSLVCFIYIHISWCIYYMYISLQMRVYEMRWERYIRSIVGWLVRLVNAVVYFHIQWTFVAVE